MHSDLKALYTTFNFKKTIKALIKIHTKSINTLIKIRTKSINSLTVLRKKADKILSAR